MRLAEELVPARKPWVLLDRVVSVEGSHRICCLKQISASDFFLVGHFPAVSIYPGVMLLAAIRQAAELLLSEQPGQTAGTPAVFDTVEMRLFHPVRPGDALLITVDRSADGRWRGVGVVEDRKVIAATFSLRSLPHSEHHSL